jgi:electron-transferring-flavoprotein dehydrogenase
MRIRRILGSAKEIWEIDPALHRPGEVVHTFGCTLDDATGGGGFLYHGRAARLRRFGLAVTRIRIRSVAEFQRWKTHPRIRSVLARGKRVARRRDREGRLAICHELVAPTRCSSAATRAF